MLLILLKHAEAVVGSLPNDQLVPNDEQNILTQEGEKEMEEIGRELANTTIPFRVICAPSKRVQESANIIAAVAKAPISIDDRLADRTQDITGMSIRDFRQNQDNAAAQPFLRQNGGESFAEQRARVDSWLADICATRDDSTYVVVTHGTTIEHLQTALLGLSPKFASQLFFRCDPSHGHIWMSSYAEGIEKWECLASNTSSFSEFILKAKNPANASTDILGQASEELADDVEALSDLRSVASTFNQNQSLSGGGSAAYHR